VLPVAPLVGAGVAEVEGCVLLAEGAQLHIQVVGAAVGGGLDDATLHSHGHGVGQVAVHAFGTQHIVLADQAGGVGDVQVRLADQLLRIDQGVIVKGCLGVGAAPHLVDVGLAAGQSDADEGRGQVLGGRRTAGEGTDGVVEARVVCGQVQRGGGGHGHARDGALVVGL